MMTNLFAYVDTFIVVFFSFSFLLFVLYIAWIAIGIAFIQPSWTASV